MSTAVVSESLASPRDVRHPVLFDGQSLPANPARGRPFLLGTSGERTAFCDSLDGWGTAQAGHNHAIASLFNVTNVVLLPDFEEPGGSEELRSQTTSLA